MIDEMQEQEIPGQPEEEAELLPGGDFIAPDVSEEARGFIQACRRLIYSDEFTPIVQQALTGAGNLIDGVVPVLMEIIARAQDKLGPLSDEDFNTVATHLAGTLVSTAKILGDPDAEDAQSAVEGIVGKMNELAQGAEQAPEEGMPEQVPQEPPPGALAQLR